MGVDHEHLNMCRAQIEHALHVHPIPVCCGSGAHHLVLVFDFLFFLVGNDFCQNLVWNHKDCEVAGVVGHVVCSFRLGCKHVRSNCCVVVWFAVLWCGLLCCGVVCCVVVWFAVAYGPTGYVPVSLGTGIGQA